MNTSMLLSAKEWAEQTFGSVRLGDHRRKRRAVLMAERIAHDPASSLPAQMHGHAEMEAAYRLLQCSDVTYEQLIQPHLRQTREAAGKVQRVLMIQDTTEVDYQQYPTTSGLGPIGKHNAHQGFFLQSVLAVEPETREVLGLAHQEPFLRQPAPAGETDWQRQFRQRESQVWEHSVQAIGLPPQAVEWIHVGDRYGDMFSFLSLCRQMNCHFVVRAAQDRCVDLLVDKDQAPVARRSHHKARGMQELKARSLHLFEVVRSWASQDRADLKLEATKKRPARTAHLEMSWGSIRLLPPENHKASGDLLPLVVWVVRVWEPNPPEGFQALEWVLLCSMSTESPVQAWERVDWYRCRWIVEDYHQGLKTGCRVEQRHLQSYEGLRRLLGVLGPVAVRLLQLRAMARQEPEQPAQEALSADVVRVVAALAHVPVAQLTAQQAWYTIAGYGGYQGRKGDGPPGWKTLWKGWLYIQAVVEGVHLASRLSLE
jgi:Transposase DNA-binding/Transposase Tn5 dimerisation domain